MAIARREKEGYQVAADWYRLFLCESISKYFPGREALRLEVLRNIRPLTSVLIFGEKRIVSLVEQVRSNPQFDRDGHYVGRTEMILGLLYKARKRRPSQFVI